jgi:hypothetical protein
VSLQFGSTEWRPEPQFFVEAVDVNTKKTRLFALQDMELLDTEKSPLMVLGRFAAVENGSERD